MNHPLFLLVSQGEEINWVKYYQLLVFLGGSVVKNPLASAEDARDKGSIPGSGRFPWSRKWQPAPVFLSEKFHGQQSLSGYTRSY